MTIVKVRPAAELPIWDWLSANVEIDAMNEDMATFMNIHTGYALSVEGADFRYDNGVLVDGRVESLSFFNENGELTMRMSGEYIVRELGYFLAGDDPSVIHDYLFSGEDTVTGSRTGDLLEAGGGNDSLSGLGGDDELVGSTGADFLTGGLGSDLFHFRPGDGVDTISDFDARGGRGMQDFIVTAISYEDIEIRKAGDDVLVDLGGGDMLHLLDAKRADIGKSDFLEALPL